MNIPEFFRIFPRLWRRKKENLLPIITNEKVIIVICSERGISDEVLNAANNQYLSGWDFETDVKFPNYEVMIYKHEHTKKNWKLKTYENIVDGKNKARVEALKTNADWFLWIDSDVVLPKTALSNFMLQARYYDGRIRYHAQGGWYPLTKDLWSGGLWIGLGFNSFLNPQPSIILTDKIELGCCFMSRDIMTNIPFRYNPKETIPHTHQGVCDCFAWSNAAWKAGYMLYYNGGVICEHLNPNSQESYAYLNSR